MKAFPRGAAVAILVLTVAVPGCRRTVFDGTADATDEERIVSQVLSTNDPLRFDVRWFPSGCEEFERVDVHESDTDIGLAVWVWVDTRDCTTTSGESSTMIELAEPVDDRSFVDANLDTTVKLDSDPGPPEDLDP